jgi:hypothetical protein
MIVTLLDGRTVDSRDLSLNRDSYRVTYLGTEDVTRNMRQSDKVSVFSGFSRERDNIRSSDDSRIAQNLPPVQVGSTSILANFTRQIVTDPLAAPLDYADDKITGRLFKSSTVRLVVLLVVLGAVFYFWPVIRPIVSRFTK